MENGTTFIDACVEGKARPEEIDDWIERWHVGETGMELHDWLGLSWEEYGNFVVAPDALPHIVEIRRLVGPARIVITHAAAKARGAVN